MSNRTNTSTRSGDDRQAAGAVAVAVGPIAALVAAGLLAKYRDSAGATNVALVLAMIVVTAALAGRLAGFVTAVTAALVFNYFHTQPYHSLRIAGLRDVVTVVLLAAIGLMVSEIGAWRRRAQSSSAQRLQGARALESVAGMIAAGRPAVEVWPMIRTILIEGMHLRDCRFEPTEVTSLPQLPRSGALVAPSMHLLPHGFALPPDGAVIPVVGRGSPLGSIILVPDPGFGSTHDERALAIALADQYAIALCLDTVPAQSKRRQLA